MIVFRFQDALGRGPYSSPTEAIRPMWDAHNEIAHDPNSRTPAPERDGTGAPGSKWRYGFTSLKQLDAWFTPEEQALLFREGFELVAIEADKWNIRESEKQCVYLREDLVTL